LDKDHLADKDLVVVDHLVVDKDLHLVVVKQNHLVVDKDLDHLILKIKICL
jgi:hypothetical protein